ncbi:TPA: hypothetical protein ACN7EP_001302 [Klebsiella pneumoniae]
MAKKAAEAEQNAELSKSKKLEGKGQKERLSTLPLDELRFFNVDPKDTGKHCHDAIYGKIANAYTFIKFINKTDQENAFSGKCYEPQNFLMSLLQADIAKEQCERKKTACTVQNYSPSHRPHNDLVLARQQHHSYWKYKFSHPLERDALRELRALINDKKKAYTRLQEHYCSMHAKARSMKKKLTLLPLSIFLDIEKKDDMDERMTYKRLKEHAALLTKQFPEVLKKLRHRSPYAAFLGCSKLVMMTDTTFEPFLHIIFYLSEGELSTWYAHDISNTWAKVAGCRVKVHYYSFTGELAEPPAHVIEKISEKNHSMSGYKLFYKEVLQPFSSEDPNQDKEGPITIREIKEEIAVLEERKGNSKPFSLARLKALKSELKQIMQCAENKNNHMDFMSRVAKNYNSIPGVTTFTQAGNFTYDKQYSNERYRARKDQHQSEKPLDSDDKGKLYTDSYNKERHNPSSEMWEIPHHSLNDEL